MAVQSRRTREESGAFKEKLLERLSNLDQVSLREGTTDLLSLLDDVELVLSSEDLTELERQGFTLIREYLKEATVLELRGLPRAPFLKKIKEIASILRKIGDLRGEGIRIITLEDLTVVGEVDGRPVYSLRQEEGDSPHR